MPETFPVLEESIATDFSSEVFVGALVQVEDDEPKLSVIYEIRDRANDQDILRVAFEFEATNPIWLVSFDPSFAAGAYGVCVSNKLAHATYDKARECYDRVKNAEPDAPIMNRLRATAKCLGGEGPAFMQEVRKALKECLTFGLLGGGGGS